MSNPPSAAESSATLDTLLSRLRDSEKQCLTAIRAQETYHDSHQSRRELPDFYFRRLDELNEASRQAVKDALRTVCDVARFGSLPDRLRSDDLSALLARAVRVENTIIGRTFGAGPDTAFEDWGSFEPACGNEVEDEAIRSDTGSALPAGISLDILKEFMAIVKIGDDPRAEASKVFGHTAKPYKDTLKPSKYTSPLARFGPGPLFLDPSRSPMAVAFSEARCEITSQRTARPSNILLDGDFLITVGCAGWKERDTILSVMNLQEGVEESTGVRGGGSDKIAFDGSRQIIWTSSSRTVQGYRLRADGSRRVPHDIHSDEDSEEEDDRDPMLFNERNNLQEVYRFKAGDSRSNAIIDLADNGNKLLRTGKKAIEIWDVATLPDHNMKGGQADSRLESPVFLNLSVMKAHPTDATQRLLAYTDEHPDREASAAQLYGVSAASLETGQVTTRYVGHSQTVHSIATNRSDPDNFITGSGDGGVRFYDSRFAAPVFCAKSRAGEDIESLLYEEVGGHPYIIIGGKQSQQIKVWDARARKALYELSTGNNVVEGLAWDPARNELFAATECTNRGYHGTSFNYRPARFGGGGGEDDDDDDEHDEDDEDRAWPTNAAHTEISFGYPFDAGDHSLIRYTFKLEPDPEQLPVYGDAVPEGENDW